jgi:hypothetical protein
MFQHSSHVQCSLIIQQWRMYETPSSLLNTLFSPSRVGWSLRYVRFVVGCKLWILIFSLMVMSICKDLVNRLCFLPWNCFLCRFLKPVRAFSWYYCLNALISNESFSISVILNVQMQKAFHITCKWHITFCVINCILIENIRHALNVTLCDSLKIFLKLSMWKVQ